MSDRPAAKSGRVRRWLVLIPLIAVGVIAPSACYYEEYGYGFDVYPAAPYGYGQYSPRYEPRYPRRSYEYFSYSHRSEIRERIEARERAEARERFEARRKEAQERFEARKSEARERAERRELPERRRPSREEFGGEKSEDWDPEEDR